MLLLYCQKFDLYKLLLTVTICLFKTCPACLKLIAVSLTTKKVFIKENYNAMIDSLIEQIVDILCG